MVSGTCYTLPMHPTLTLILPLILTLIIQMEGRAMAAEAKLAEATLTMAETERARTALEAQLGTLTHA